VIRLAAGAASILLVGGIAATASACEASQASALAQQWRVAATFSAKGGATQIAGIDAVSGSDAWAAGKTYFSAKKSTPLLEHWAGHSWRRVTLPAQTARAWLADGISSVGASSATNVWAFGGAAPTGIRYAHLSGHRWILGAVPDTALSRPRKSATIIGQVSVISRTDVGIRCAPDGPAGDAVRGPVHWSSLANQEGARDWRDRGGDRDLPA